MNRLILLTWLCALLSLSGCGKFNILPEKASSEIDVRKIREALIASHEAQERLYIGASCRVSSSREGGAFGLEILAENKPARMRLETKSFFGTALSLLIADQENIGLLDFHERRAITASSTRENMAKLFLLPLSAEDLQKILFAKAPIRNPHKVSIHPARESEDIVLIETRGSKKLVAVVEPKRLFLRRAYMKQGEHILWQIRLDDYRLKDKRPYPNKITYRQLNPQALVTITIKETDFQMEPEEEVFKFSPPEGFELIELP